jgi:hypothetical protein
MFDRSAAASRLERLWALSAQFGSERGANRVFLDEMVSDRLQLLSGLQVLRDELQFAVPPAGSDREACAADFSQPTVLTTLAFTNCGDRIHHGEMEQYQQVVASRFATLSEVGTLKPEGFHPTGGGTDDGATLAHVTWAHAFDEPLQKRLYEGNRQSFVMCAFDLKTHCGRLDSDDGSIAFGKTRESPWREPRAACGAIVGALAAFNEANGVHVRIRRVLGEANYELLAKKGLKTKEGVDITAVVAAAIVAVRGMQDTANALMHEMDKRGLAHLTASTTVNRSAMRDTIIYYARATVFDGEIRMQGFGTDASKYAGSLVEHRGEKRLHLSYAGVEGTKLPIEKSTYDVLKSVPVDFYA